ncbi:MAG TPA: hypothetical protein VHK67_04880 [Rhabdochlamydiaceae bacterium]|jgi:hypothetical protein|nr:hypothetical protein [Rhabdochlamydiaceae bacterium]
MATNPLYLNTPPLAEKDRKVQLTVVKGDTAQNVSLNDLMNQICAMIQLLHIVEGQLETNQSKLATENNQAAELNVEAISGQGNQAIEKAKQAETIAQRPWWETLIQVVLAVVALVASFVTFGVVGLVLTAALLVLTTVPIPGLSGKTVTGFIASKIAEALGKAHNWSQAKIQEVTGYINLAIGVVLAVASFGIGFAGASASAASAATTVVEEVVDDGVEMTDMVLETGSSATEDSANSAEETASSTSSNAMKAAKFGAITAFVSQVAGSNCLSDIIMGSLMNYDPHASETTKEVVEAIAAVLTILVAIVGAIMSGKVALPEVGAELGQDSSLLGKLAARLGTSVSRLTSAVMTGTGIAQGALSGYQGGCDIYSAVLQSQVIRLLGQEKVSQETSEMISQTMNQINAMLKVISDDFNQLLSNIKNIGRFGASEAAAMMKASQSA